MNTTPVCPICGNPAEPGASQGLCPECLAKSALETRSENQPPEQKTAVETNAATRLAAASAAGASPPPPPIPATAPVASSLAGWRIALLAGGLVALLLLLMASLVVLLAVNKQHRVLPRKGLVASWSGDGNANDSAGNNNGILENITFTNGVAGQAFYLNGSDADVQIPDSPGLKPDRVTVEAWVKLDALASPVAAYPGLQYIVFKKNSRGGNFEAYELEKNRLNGLDMFRFQVTSAEGQQVPAASTTVPEAGVWYFLAGTYDGETVKLYVNGVLEGSAHAGFPLDYDTRPVFIGTSGEDWDGRVQGAVCGVSIYDRALSDKEIAAHYSPGATPKSSHFLQKLPAEFATAMNANDFGRAQSVAAEVTRQDPQFAEGWVADGMASARLGQPDRARQDYERALALYQDKSRQNPSDANPVRQQIFLLALLDRPAEAETLLAQARSNYPNDSQVATMAQNFTEMRIGWTNWMVKSQ